MPTNRFFIFLFLSTLILTIIASAIAEPLFPQMSDPVYRAAHIHYVIIGFFMAFLVMVFSMVPIGVRVFLKSLWGRVLSEQQERMATKIILLVWAVFTIGLLIALPVMIWDGLFSGNL